MDYHLLMNEMFVIVLSLDSEIFRHGIQLVINCAILDILTGLVIHRADGSESLVSMGEFNFYYG